MGNSILGTRIKNLREEKSITQLQLSKILNIGNTTLSQYESGKRVPSDSIKKAIADYFNVSIDYLLGRTDIKNTPNFEEDTPTEKIAKLVKENKIETLAAHFDGEDITDDDVEDIKNFIEFVVEKRKKKNK